MAKETKSETPGAPPYISFRTLTNLLDRLQETHLPPRIDRSYLDGMSGGYQTQVIAALRWLDLIGENGEVTGALTGLVKAGPELRPGLIGAILRSHYEPIFVLSAKNGTQGELEDAFRAYGISASTLRRAIAFFMHAAQYAEIAISPHFKVPATRTNGKPARKPRSKPPGAAADAPEPPAQTPPDDLRTRYVDMLLKKAESQEAMDPELLDRIETLLGYGTEPQE